jgi:rhodanese-related sulfurtransferase
MLGSGGVLLDVRQPAEFRLDGHLDGSINVPAYSWEHGFHLPNEEFAAEVAETYAADEPLLLVCADGRLSEGAAAVLEAAAFTNVHTLDGGLQATGEEDGLPPYVVDEDGEGGLTGAWV